MQSRVSRPVLAQRASSGSRPSSTSIRAGLLNARRQLALRSPRAARKDETVVDDQIGEFCSIDTQGKKAEKRTLGEMEAEFLDALRAFYYDDKPNLTNEEFDNLKEELVWQGSKVAVLSSDEQRFLEASLAYAADKPIMSDAEFDVLKLKLKQAGSDITVQGPRCSIRSKKLYSDSRPDYLKMTALNVPAAVAVLGSLYAVDALSGYSITNLIELPAPYGIIAVWGLVLPTTLVFATAITNAIFTDSVILTAPCPSCGTETFSYFGDILTVSGNRGKNVVECGNCKSKLVFDENKRSVTVQEPETVKA